MKRVLLIFIALMATITVQAQQFEWATSFSGGNANNSVKFSATDSQGNLYIAGQCCPGVTLNGTLLLNMTPYGPFNNHTNFFIAKLSPEGQVIWRKAIHNNNGGTTGCNYMTIVGDSSIFFSVDYQLATESNYLYYLDTLIPATAYNQPFPDYPFPIVDGYGYGTGFITLDLNGNLKEHHFVQTTYIDSIGNVITLGQHDTIPALVTSSMMGYFHIDNQGNMYMSRNTNDLCAVYCDTCEGNLENYSFINNKLGGIRFIIDGHQRTFDFYPNGSGEQLGYNNKMFLKFSAHFNDLLWAKYMIKDTVGNGENPSIFEPLITGMTGDDEGNIYACGYIDHTPPDNDTTYYRDLILDSNNLSQIIKCKQDYWFVSFLIKYDSGGNVIYAKQLKSNIDYSANYGMDPMSAFNALTLNDSNIFVLGSAQKNLSNDTSSSHSQFVIDNNNINLRNNVFFLRFDKNNGHYISYGKVNTPYTSCVRGMHDHHDIVSINNQLFTQFEYTGDLYLRDTIYRNPFGVFRIGMIRWDNDGHIIGGLDYNAPGNGNYTGATTIDNSGNLYLTGTIVGDATFGDITVSNGGYIAKLVDSTFNTPYVYVPDTLSINEEIAIGAMKVYPNPTQSKITIDMGNERIKECYLTPILGQREKIHPQDNGNGRYTIDLSRYPNYTYIITAQSATKSYQVKVVKVR